MECINISYLEHQVVRLEVCVDDANLVKGLHHLEELNGEVDGHGLNTGLGNFSRLDDVDYVK